jgi:hypothetical protein
MLHQQTRILHHHQSRPPRLLCRLRILNPQLHPQNLRLNPDRRLRHPWQILASPEHIHDIHRFRHILQPRVRLLSQHFPLVRIHRNNPVTRALQIRGYLMRSPHRVRRQSHHRNRLRPAQYPRHRVPTLPISIRQMYPHPLNQPRLQPVPSRRGGFTPPSSLLPAVCSTGIPACALRSKVTPPTS